MASKWLKKLLPLLGILAIYFLFSLLTFRDYGITTDEPLEYMWGRELASHLSRETKFENTIEPAYDQEPAHRRHTPVLSKYNRWYSALVTQFNPPEFYERAHFINLMFSSLLLIAVYIVVLSHYKRSLPAVIATIFTALTPRLLGHFPANPKDIPFAIMYFISTMSVLFTVRTVKNPLHKVMILALPFALTQGMRIVGFTLYGTYLIMEWIKNKKIAWAETIVLFGAASFIMVWTWPHIGVNFFKNFQHILVDSQTYNFWDKNLFFMGEMIPVEQRPWYYLFVFLGVTLPLFVLIPVLVNIKTAKRFKNNDIVKVSWIALALNFILYLIFDPLTYNGMRHFLYLLPFLTLIGGITVYEFLFAEKTHRYRRLLLAVVAVNILTVVLALVKLHPYEYTYYNELVGGTRNASKHFVVDYWDVSYKPAMTWFFENIATDKDQTYYVKTCNLSAGVEYYARIADVDIEMTIPEDLETYYEVCDHFRSIDKHLTIDPNDEEILHIEKIDGIPLNYVRKINPGSKTL